MVFNSLLFLVFWLSLLVLYYGVVPSKYRASLLLVVSYGFYATYEPKYVLIMGGVTLFSFYLSRFFVEKYSLVTKSRLIKLALTVCVIILIVFKYYNFLNENVSALASFLKVNYDVPYLDLLLPVGISFFIFENIGYLLDIYYGIREPEKRLDKYALFISYFPKLLAGPIERSTVLLPQFYFAPKLNLDRIVWGMKLFLMGAFKKVVIADRLALIVNPVYENPSEYDFLTVTIGTVAFMFQMYCDFSGYTDMAMGISKTFGFDLNDNFNFPFISKNITEFWRRWHISLSTWLRDYLYTPIMFAKKHWGTWCLVYASFITFILCGLWHGPKWTFVVFGLLQGLAVTYEIFTKSFRQKLFKRMHVKVYNFWSWFLTFGFVAFSFVFFRADNLQDASIVIQKFVSLNIDVSVFYQFVQLVTPSVFALTVLLLIGFILIDQPITTRIKKGERFNQFLEPIVYPLLLVSIVLFGYFGKIEFIYFHF